MSANCNPFSKYPIILHMSITFGIIFLKLVHSNQIPPEVMKYGQSQQQLINNFNINNLDTIPETMILEQMLRYSQHSYNTDPSIYPSNPTLSQFSEENADSIEAIVAQNEEICSSLQLNSEECFIDCVYYLSPITLLSDNTTTDEFGKVLSWYQMGGGPIGWYETGNPDMCKYMEGTYCFTPISVTEGMFVMNLQEHGCCVPGTCVGQDAEKVLQQNAWCYQGYNLSYNMLMFGGLFGIDNVCEPLERDLTSPGFVMVIIVFILFAIAVVLASIKSQYFTEKYIDNVENETFQDALNNDWFLYSFSIQNLYKILIRRRPKSKSQYNFLDGIRVISMSWVIWGHVYVYYLMSSPSNQAVLMPFDSTAAAKYPYVFTQFYMMIAEYGFFSVDSFFYLSGFLGAFALYRTIEKYGDKAIRTFYVWIPLSYLHRFLRIFPMMTFVLFVQWFVADQLPYSYRVTSRDINSELCQDSWYKVLFFYANLEKDMSDLGCMGHLWYIQCDMQMFLFLPWILLLFKWKKICGLIASFLPFLICIGIRIYFAIYYHFGANFLYPANEEINGGSQQQQYFKPWTRMGTYFIGTFTLLLILTVKDNNKKFKIESRYIYLSTISLSGFIFSCLVFWPYSDVNDAPANRWSLLQNQIYYSLCRPIWGAALGILSFAFVFKLNKIKSIICTLLSLEIYQPLGKLTYTMYLIHWMMLSYFFGDLNTSTYYEFWWVLCIFFAIWFVTMFCTLILWFLIEQPVANLMGLAMKALINSFKNNKNKNKSSMDSELTNVVKIKTKTKIKNNNGHNVMDKLLIEGNDNANANGLDQSHTASYGIGGNYESFIGASEDNDHNEYISIKSSNQT